MPCHTHSVSRHTHDVPRHTQDVPRHTHGVRHVILTVRHVILTVRHVILTACQVEPAVSSVFSSSTHLSAPILARWYRILVPAMPPPMITVSASSGHDVTLQQRHLYFMQYTICHKLRKHYTRVQKQFVPSLNACYCPSKLATIQSCAPVCNNTNNSFPVSRGATCTVHTPNSFTRRHTLILQSLEH